MDNNNDFDVLDEELNSQKKGAPNSTLSSLCVLVIIGSGFTFLKNLYTFQLYEGDADLNWVYLTEFLSCASCIIGAILMLRLRLIGFYLYTISNIAYLFAVIWYWMGIVGVPLGDWMILIVFVYIAAPVGFIILLSSQKQYLN